MSVHVDDSYLKHRFSVTSPEKWKPTYSMFSTLRGLMKTAMGWRPAIWRRFMAFPDTSSMQCFPCMIQIIKMAPFPSLHHHIYTHLFRHFFHRLYAGSIQMVVVLSSLDEFVLLDLSFHDLSGGDKVVISAVHLIVSPGSCCVWGHMPEI